jgi:hypothetical protein
MDRDQVNVSGKCGKIKNRPCLAEKASLALGGGGRGFSWQRLRRLKATARLRDTTFFGLERLKP